MNKIIILLMLLFIFSSCTSTSTSTNTNTNTDSDDIKLVTEPTFEITESVPESDAFSFPGLVGDSMVLQRNSVLTIWGNYDKDGPVAAEINGKIYFGECTNNTFEIDILTGAENNLFDITIYSETEKAIIHDVLLGEVFIVAGQSNLVRNMQQISAPELSQDINNDNFRFVNVPWKKTFEEPVTTPVTELPLKWEKISSSTAPYFSAAAYYFGETMYENLDVPIGIIWAAAGDTIIASWLPNEDAASLPTIYQEVRSSTFVRSPSHMYNTMISPIIRYKARGVIWYQGENQYYQYDEFLTKLINVWRREFQNDKLEFTIIQLPGFGEGWALNWAEIRESQKKVTESLPYCTISINIDCGEEFDIHPKDKKPIGQRAAYATLTEFFNIEGLPQSPYLKSFRVEGDTLVLEFENVQGALVLKNNGVGFEISSDGTIYYDAVAKVENNKVILSSDNVKNPKNAKYAYSNFPQVSLYNTEGMPAQQFNVKLE